MLGVPEEYRQQVREWVDTSLHREPGQIDMSEKGMQAVAESMGLYYHLIQERRANPQDDMFSRLVAAEIDARGRREGVPRRLRDRRIRNPSGWRRRRDRHQTGGQCGGDVRPQSRSVAEAARRPQQDPRRGRGTAAVRAARALQRAAVHERGPPARSHDPGRQARVPAGRFGASRSRGVHRSPTPSTSTATAPRRRTSASGTGCTAVWARRWPGWRARSRWSDCSTSCRATR